MSREAFGINTWHTVYVEIFARRKFLPISPSALIGEIFIVRIFCPALMITLRIWIYSTEYICINKGSWAWRNFCPAKILLYTVIIIYCVPIICDSHNYTKECIHKSVYIWHTKHQYIAVRVYYYNTLDYSVDIIVIVTCTLLWKLIEAIRIQSHANKFNY